MPVGAFVPSRIHLDYPEWTVPAVGSTDTGKAWAWNHATGKYEPATFLLPSAVSAYGLTLIDDADASAARATLGLGTAAVLNVGTGANQIVQLDGSSRLPAVDGSLLTGISGGSGSPGGSTTQVQYNSAGAFAGDAGMTYDAANDRLTVAGGLVAGDWSPPSDSTTAVSIWNAARSSRALTVDTTGNDIVVGRYVKWTSVPTTAGFSFVNPGNFAATLAVSSPSGDLVWADETSGTPTERARFNLNGGFSTTGGQATFNSDVMIGNVGDTSSKYLIFPRLFNDAITIQTFRADANGYADRVALTSGTILGSGAGTAYLRLRDTYLGIAVEAPTALLTLAASSTTRSSFRMIAGTAPTTPNAGDIWYPTGDRLKLYRAVTETIASGVPGTGGSATATGTWGATEMAMLQAIYDAGRAFGLLS